MCDFNKYVFHISVCKRLRSFHSTPTDHHGFIRNFFDETFLFGFTDMKI